MTWTGRLAKRAVLELVRSTSEKRPRGTGSSPRAWAAWRRSLLEKPYETIGGRLRRLRATIDTTNDERGMWSNADVRWLIEMAEARVRDKAPPSGGER